MRIKQRNAPFQGLGLVVVGMSLLFCMFLLGFSILNYHESPLPAVKDGTSQGGAAGAGEWASTVVGLQLPVLTTARAKIALAALSDPDWEVASTGTPVTPADPTDEGTAVSAGNKPVIMLYSSHSNESYLKVEGQKYTELPNTRTMDKEYNILKVNKTLSGLLKDTYHLPVLFDSTDYELGKYYTTSYERSLKGIEKAKKQYESLKVFFDIHRDATGPANKGDVVMVDGKPCAKIMFVVGTGEGKTGTGFGQRPNWQQNKALAEKLMAAINKLAPGLCKQVRVKTGRYNQHVSDSAVAVEIGHNQNTLQEVLNAVPYLAQAMSEVMRQDLDIKTVSVP